MIIQRRGQCGNPKDFFAKSFEEYRKGFGANCELWIGLDKLYELTRTGKWELLIEGVRWDNGTKVKSRYAKFSVGPFPRYFQKVFHSSQHQFCQFLVSK